MLKSFSLIWGLDKALGLGRTGWHERILVGQVLMGEFWNLASYGIGSGAGERKPRGILIRQSLIGQFCICPYLVWAPEGPYVRERLLCKGLWWLHICYLSPVTWRFLVQLMLRKEWHTRSAVSVK